MTLSVEDSLICRSYFFDYGMSFVGGQIAWRLPIACQMLFAFVSSAPHISSAPILMSL